MKTIVVALGGNAILKEGEKPTIAGQFKNTKNAMKEIFYLSKKYNLILTHGNGPQVGNILIRVEEALGKAYSLPLSVCVAESEGELGYIIQQSLQNVFSENKIKKPVVSLLTQVAVDKKDPNFEKPTKPIGPFYDRKKASILHSKGFHLVEDSGRGYRRVVPSPRPLKIIEADVIKKLVKMGVTVIAAGGGGIPVYENKGLHGIDAVIDKDLASACLAQSVGAEILIMLTGVKNVYVDYKTKNQKALKKISVKEAKKYFKQGHFPEGSMGPKIEAAINFLGSGGKKVIITSPEYLEKALREKEGTIITR